MLLLEPAMQSSFSFLWHSHRNILRTCSSSVDQSGSVNTQHVEKLNTVWENGKFDSGQKVYCIQHLWRHCDHSCRADAMESLMNWLFRQWHLLELQIKVDLASLEALYAFSCEFVRIYLKYVAVAGERDCFCSACEGERTSGQWVYIIYV